MSAEQPTLSVVDGGMQDTGSDDGAESDSQGKSHLEPKPGKKTRGRVKIKFEYIRQKDKRFTTFSKRKTGLMKKAYELSALTGTQVMLLVASETGHVYTFATRKLMPIVTSDQGKALVQTCLSTPDEALGSVGSNTGESGNDKPADRDSPDAKKQKVSGAKGEASKSSASTARGNSSVSDSRGVVSIQPASHNVQKVDDTPFMLSSMSSLSDIQDDEVFTVTPQHCPQSTVTLQPCHQTSPSSSFAFTTSPEQFSRLTAGQAMPATTQTSADPVYHLLPFSGDIGGVNCGNKNSSLSTNLPSSTVVFNGGTVLPAVSTQSTLLQQVYCVIPGTNQLISIPLDSPAAARLLQPRTQEVITQHPRGIQSSAPQQSLSQVPPQSLQCGQTVLAHNSAINGGDVMHVPAGLVNDGSGFIRLYLA